MMRPLEHDPKREGFPRLVLIVDDDLEAGGALAKVLELRGFRVSLCRDGSSALGLLRGDARPDFILTDLLLPDMDGREVAREARRLAPKARIALITGWSFDENPDSSLVDAVFLKPIEIRAVIDAFLTPEAGA